MHFLFFLLEKDGIHMEEYAHNPEQNSAETEHYETAVNDQARFLFLRHFIFELYFQQAHIFEGAHVLLSLLEQDGTPMEEFAHNAEQNTAETEHYEAAVNDQVCSLFLSHLFVRYLLSRHIC